MSNYIITGATSGIGEACTKTLASDDNRLIIVGRNTDKLYDLKNKLPGEIIPIEYDLNDLSNVGSLFEPCSKLGFKLDGMVYSAGIDSAWPVKVNNTSKMQEIMTVNCFAFVEMCRYFYSKKNSADGSSIVAISSLASVLNEKGNCAYSMSKAALNSSIKTISKEYIRRKIRVNAILPGGVNTPMGNSKGELLASAKEENVNESPDEQPLGAMTGKDIADIVCFLLNPTGAFFTGELITVSGGRVH